MSKKQSRWIGDEETNSLKYSLGLDNQVRSIKRGIQRICLHHESGRRFANSSDVRLALHSHLASPDTLVRRWALKALGLIGDPKDASRIAERFKVEPDFEAQTWAAASLLSIGTDMSLDELTALTNLPNAKSLVLASTLYSSRTWLRTNWKPIEVSVDDDDLSLKWAAFLIGYNKIQGNFLKSPLSEQKFLSELKAHATPEISEYSIWALWQRSEYDFSHAGIDLSFRSKFPDNVRKWIYQLALKPQSNPLIDSDLLHDLRLDRSAAAREGLATGLRNVDNHSIDEEVLRWNDVEQDDVVKSFLLDYICSRNYLNTDFMEYAEKQFKGGLLTPGIRARMLASASQTPLFSRLKQIETLDNINSQAALQLLPVGSTQLASGLTIVNNNISFGNVTAQNLVVGDIINSTNSAIQNMPDNRSDDKDKLAAILNFARSSSIADTEKAEIASKVSAVVAEPKDDAKKGIFAYLKRLGEAATIGGGALEGIDKILEFISDWQ